VSGFVPDIMLSLWHQQYNAPGWVGNVYSCCTRGHRFGSHHCWLANRGAAFDVIRSVYMF